MLRSLGLDHKIKFRRTGDPSFKALRSMKRVRGTLADPFRWAEVRRLERAMIPEYEKALDTLTKGLRPEQPRRRRRDRLTARPSPRLRTHQARAGQEVPNRALTRLRSFMSRSVAGTGDWRDMKGVSASGG